MTYYVKPLPGAAGSGRFTIFLAGSIEMGKAERWQDVVEKSLEEYSNNLVVLNPRRDDWDSSWKQDPSTGTEFQKQVNWELAGLDCADVVFFYFSPGTISPISLLELGLILGSGKDCVVVCPKDFHRYGNVVLTVSDWTDEVVWETLEDGISALKSKIPLNCEYDF